MEVKLVAATQGAGELIGRSAQDVLSFVTRVSNPANQANFDTAPKLLAYCIKHSHWSPFEHAFLTLEITTSRGIAAQILRHRSFTFQEFSQRYAEAHEFEFPLPRRQDLKNRQNSIDDLPGEVLEWWASTQRRLQLEAEYAYDQALKRGIAKECARFLLPLSTQTTLYMTGSVRSWIHYIELRSSADTQLEHRAIALACRSLLASVVPDVAQALGWPTDASPATAPSPL